MEKKNNADIDLIGNIPSVFKAMEDLQKRMMNRFESFGLEINDIRNWKDPKNTLGRLENIELAIQELRERQQIDSANVRALMADGRLIAKYSDAEIQDYYHRAGVPIKEVAKKFNVTDMQASRYVKGDINDLQVRNDLVIFLRGKTIERENRKV